MKLLATLVLALLLSGCGGGGGADNSTAAAPVKAVAAPAGKDWTQTVSQTAEGFVMGNPAAPIKLVEYGSRLCPTCGAFANDGYQTLTGKYVKSGKVSFEFREFLVHGQLDVPPALLGTCVGTDPFFPLLEQMFHDQQSFEENLQKSGPAMQQRIDAAAPKDRFLLMGEAMGLVDYAKQRGVPEAKARACLADMAQVDKLTKITQDKGPGGDATVSGTPTFLLNGKIAEGVISWPAMEQALKRLGA